jgi:hypothetical protein
MSGFKTSLLKFLLNLDLLHSSCLNKSISRCCCCLLLPNFLVLYVTWRPFVFLNQFDLNLFMITTENSSIFRLLTKESMLLTSATLNDIQITSDYMSRWVVLKRRVGALTSQRVLKVLFYVNILQCFFVVLTKEA